MFWAASRYDQWQLYDTFLDPLCICYERYNKQCCIGYPPHTVAYIDAQTELRHAHTRTVA